MADNEKKVPEAASQGMSRRAFVTGVGGAGVGLVLGGLLVKGFILPEEVIAIPASKGYLVVDTKKCAGCTSCMLACSLVHHGQCNYSLSRVQITQTSYAPFPDDIEINQCRQCAYPACVDACPTGALSVDTANGNVRTVDESKCIGCERCIQACPFTPSRVQWNTEDRHAQKCDLCADTPYWSEEGGPGGKQACVEVCPVKAISFIAQIPVQGDAGYNVDLGHTSANWVALGFAGAAAGGGQ